MEKLRFKFLATAFFVLFVTLPGIGSAQICRDVFKFSNINQYEEYRGLARREFNLLRWKLSFNKSSTLDRMELEIRGRLLRDYGVKKFGMHGVFWGRATKKDFEGVGLLAKKDIEADDKKAVFAFKSESGSILSALSIFAFDFPNLVGRLLHPREDILSKYWNPEFIILFDRDYSKFGISSEDITDSSNQSHITFEEAYLQKNNQVGIPYEMFVVPPIFVDPPEGILGVSKAEMILWRLLLIKHALVSAKADFNLRENKF